MNRAIAFVPWMFVLLWSTGFVGAKYALPFIEPFYLLFLRMLFTLVVFAGLCFMFKPRWPAPVEAGHQMVTGFLVHGCYLGGVFAAIKLGMPAGITAIFVGLQPLLTALLSWRWFGQKLLSVQWLGMALGLLGVSVVILSGQQGGANLNVGLGAFVAVGCALIAISVGTLYQKQFGGSVDLLAGSVYQYISTAIFMGLLAFLFEERVVQWTPTLWLAMAWLVFGLSVAAILLLMLMIREGESARVASFFYLVPPAAAIEAWLLFDEQLSLLQLAAIGVTVFGVYLVLRRR
ncbi:DMT family transporter [Aliamphritea ceti]|uniref:DMT family transporter n=1 Tax=Aliamphritea ceti TaxID=1524258 RepID=UPI0021C3C82C|nr:DMT family transporter [Aliamphritea ceti]